MSFAIEEGAMKTGYSEIEPMHVLPEFVCVAIPGEELERPDKTNLRPKKKSGKVAKLKTRSEKNPKRKSKRT